MVYDTNIFYHQFSNWLKKDPLGHHIAFNEINFFRRMMTDIFGFYAVQIGLPAYDLLDGCRITHCAIVDEINPVTVMSRLTILPFQQESIDLILLPHTLDFHEEPLKILSEVSHTLIQGGHLLLTGFNPFSLWGMRHFFQKKSSKIPWSGAFFSLNRLKQWCQLMGLEIEMGYFMVYMPPFLSSLKYCQLIDNIGDRWWPTGAAIYGIRAIKQTYHVRCRIPKWKSIGITKPLAISNTDNKYLL